MSEQEKNPVGPPTKYHDKIPEDLKAFFKDIKPLLLNDVEVGFILPTIEKFCCEIDIVTSTFYKWCKEKPDLSSAFSMAKQYQKDWIIQLANNGIYREGFAKFTAINCTDMKEKIETTNTNTEIILNIDKEDQNL